jgi:hypothetical protein
VTSNLLITLLKVWCDASVADNLAGIGGVIPEISNDDKKDSFGAIVIIGLLLVGVDQFEVFGVIHPKNNGTVALGDMGYMFV